MTISDDDINRIIGADETQTEQASKLLDTHVEQLMNHFDTVQIMCTRYVNGESTTQYFSYGKGNAMARMQYARLWLEDQEGLFLRGMRGSDD